MPHTYVPVVPGVNLSKALDGKRLTKKWVREMMLAHPEWDWRNIGPSRGTYINGQDCVTYDVTLEVRDPKSMSLVALVTFQPTDANEWGYQAVVR